MTKINYSSKICISISKLIFCHPNIIKRYPNGLGQDWTDKDRKAIGALGCVDLLLQYPTASLKVIVHTLY